MKKIMLIMALLCVIVIGLNLVEAQKTTTSTNAGTAASALPQATTGQTETVLNSYAGNLSNESLDFLTSYRFFGAAAFDFAETVHFKAPKSGWKLNRIELIGWDGFNGSASTVPSAQSVAYEIRDKNLNLLYSFNDIQLPYTNFVMNITSPIPVFFDLPSIPVSDDFYVCFYDRAAVLVGTEAINSTGNSYFYDRVSGKLVPATLPVSENQTINVNWIMRAYGQ